MIENKAVEKMLLTLLGFTILAILVVPPWLTRDAYPYYASPLSKDSVKKLGQHISWELDIVETEPGVHIPGIIKAAADSTTQWVFFIPGNGGGQLSSGQQYLLDLSEGASGGKNWGLAVWGMRGFDSAGGSPNAQGFQTDYLKLYNRLIDHYGADPRNIHIVGFSFGTDLALLLVAELTKASLPPASLTLLSTQGLTTEKWKMRRKEWIYRWYVPDSYDLGEALSVIKVPALIIESENDILGDADYLLAGLMGEKQYLILSGGEHTSSLKEPEALRTVTQWISYNNDK